MAEDKHQINVVVMIFNVRYMLKYNKLTCLCLSCVFSMFLCAACSEKDTGGNGGYVKPNPPAGETVEPTDQSSPNVIACDFDTKDREIVSNEGTNSSFEKVSAPSGSRYCGCVTNVGGTYDCCMFSFDRPLDFTRNKPVITFKARGPKAGVEVMVKLIGTGKNKGDAPDAYLTIKNTKADVWEELKFDYTSQNLKSNYYTGMYIYFNVGKENKTAGEKWYFDDITVPDDDLAPLCLFQRVGGSRLPKPTSAYSWISNSTANPDVMSPDRSIDGRWWLFIRGGDGKYGQLGVYTQDADSFDPLGPWDYYNGNPVIPRGFHGDADSFTAIDPCPVVADGKLYLYYKGTNNKNVLESGKYEPSILLATSSDGYNYTKVEEVWQQNAGVAEAIYNDGKIYLFVSRRVYVSDNLLSGADAVQHTDIVAKGDGPSFFDRYSINGQKVCRLSGVDKWLMIYQGSPCHDDFPARFHVAMSDDLIHWTKVRNDQPFFSRGNRGTWDQGAVWAPEIFEVGDVLYMYYEGWGTVGDVDNRDKKYFTPGHSEIGIASCNKEDFLKWCGLK